MNAANDNDFKPWPYEPTSDADILAQRDEADEAYIGHRWADLKTLLIALALVGAILAGVFMPLIPPWLPQ
jgi:hypothetical protein